MDKVIQASSDPRADPDYDCEYFDNGSYACSYVGGSSSAGW